MNTSLLISAPQTSALPIPSSEVSLPQKIKITYKASDVAPILADVSAKYVVINSELIIQHLESLGFVLRSIQRSKGLTRVHTIRMRAKKAVKIGGETLFPEIVIKNSYDKTCGFSMESGIFRLVCSNGLVIRAKEFGGEAFYTRHIGNEALIAQEMADAFAKNLDPVMKVHGLLSEKILTDDQALDLALRASEIRWNREFARDEVKVLLEVKRPEDDSMTAWHVFNRLQENTLTGGKKFGDLKKTPRPVTKAKDHADINERLFDAVLEMATTDGVKFKFSGRTISQN